MLKVVTAGKNRMNAQHNAVNKIKIVCQICNNFGHNVKDCRFKIEQNAAASSHYSISILLVKSKDISSKVVNYES